jgi:hypothetical protein
MANKFSTKPHVFYGLDFPYWCHKMQSYIMTQDYNIWLKVVVPYEIPEQLNTAVEFENNYKARNILLSEISRLDFDRVSHLQTANEI